MVKKILGLSKLMVLIAISIILFGVYSAIYIPKESTPDIQLPTVSVVVTNRGMSPVDVETLITRPIEREVLKLNGIDEMISRSFEGRSFVRISFDSDVDINEAIDEVKDKIDIAQVDFPSEADEPIISETNVALFPIISIGFTSSELESRELIEFTRDVKEEIESLNGVFEVEMLGDVDDIVSVNVPIKNFYSFNVSPRDIASSIQENNASLPSGSVDTQLSVQSFSSPGLFKNIKDIEEVPAFSSNRASVKLGDFAEVKRDTRDKTSSSYINNKDSITLEVSKNIGYSSLDVVKEVKGYIESISTENVTIYYMEDSSEDVKNMLTSLSNTVLLTMIVVFFIIFLFMGLKSAISLSLTIPMSFLMTFIVLFLLGYTINNVALFGLILVTGMLVDSAIVVSEYADKIKQDGVKTKQAYIQSSIRMSRPIIISVLTTVFAFLPVMFWPGTTGDFMMYIPLTVIITLLSSLFVSLFILPTIAGVFSFRSKQITISRKNFILKYYKKLVIKCLRNPLKLIVLSFFLAGSMFTYYYHYNVGMSFFPSGDSDFISVNIYKKGNHSLASMEKDMSLVSDILLEADGVDINSARVRESSYSDSIGQIQLQLKDWKERKDSKEIQDGIRELLDKELPDYLSYEISQRSRGPSSSDGLRLEASSSNIYELNNFATNLMSELESSNLGLISINTERKNSDKEIQVKINDEKARLFGINKTEVASFISLMTNGVRAGSVTLEDMDDSWDVLIFVPEDERTIDKLLNMNILGEKGWVPIKAITELREEDKTSVIRRTDGKRTLVIRADVEEEVNIFNIIEDINATVEKEKEEFSSVETKIRGQVEDADETSHFMIIAFLTSIFLMLSALLYQFNSYIKSLLVFVAVAFSTIGVFFIVAALGQEFSVVFSGLAILSLAGISINHNIILIDEFLYLKNKGYNSKLAALFSATSRFKPIMLTVMTTSIGLSPMIFEVSIDFIKLEVLFGDPAMATWSQMASNIAGGLFISAIISLLLTPTILSFVDNKH
jgi:multidrug efflux pump